MTYRDLCRRLQDAGIESAEWDAQVLIEHFCSANEAMRCRLAPSEEIICNDAFTAAVERRLTRYPLQYLVGEWDFYHQTYEVTPDCLIPRSDTELLVEQAIKLLPQGARFADLCTGSGCIAISTLAERSDTSAIAVDKFPKTLAIAERNAKRNGVADRLQLRCADVLARNALEGEGALDAILCNPPYIRTEVLRELAPELSAEPVAALDGGEDGLIFYETLLRDAAQYLTRDGFFLFEIGYDQGEDLRRLGVQHGFDEIRVLRDLGGCDRVVYLSRTHA